MRSWELKVQLLEMVNLCNFSKQSQHINQLHETKCRVAHGFYLDTVTKNSNFMDFVCCVFSICELLKYLVNR